MTLLSHLHGVFGVGQCPTLIHGICLPTPRLYVPGAVLVHKAEEKRAGVLGSLCEGPWNPAGIMLNIQIRLLSWLPVEEPSGVAEGWVNTS